MSNKSEKSMGMISGWTNTAGRISEDRYPSVDSGAGEAIGKVCKDERFREKE
ncbi:MAG: hypothetical protein HFG71_10585 [Hungatella sp.]|jgi:hypothetical protein|nr:hypothetical protein [Hungatella sp.]